MKISILFFIFSVLLGGNYVSSEQLFKWETLNEHSTGEVVVVEPALYIPLNVSYTINVTVTARTGIVLCIQESVRLTAGLTSCNPDGLLNFTITPNNGNETVLSSSSSSSAFSSKQAQKMFKRQMKKLNKDHHGYGTGGAKILPHDSFDFFVPSFFVAEDPYHLQTLSLTTSLRLDRLYYLSFYSTPYQFLNTTTVAITITAEECSGTTIGKDCQEASTIERLWNTEFKNVEIKPKEAKTYGIQPNVQPVPDQYFNELVLRLKSPTNASLGPLDVGLRRGNIPDASYYDSFASSTTDSLELTVVNPSFDPVGWFVVVTNHGDDPVHYDILNQLELCKPGFFGQDCVVARNKTAIDTSKITLKDNVLDKSRTKKEKHKEGEPWVFHYFTLEAPSLVLGIGREGDENVDTYVSVDQPASIDSYLMANQNSSEDVHLFQASFPSSENPSSYYFYESSLDEKNHTWFIAVNASDDYALWVFWPCAKNCSDHGMCLPSTGVCECDDDYDNYDCSDKPFPLVWIIVIAIVGALVLALVIGIPLSCYLKGKRAKDYTRV